MGTNMTNWRAYLTATSWQHTLSICLAAHFLNSGLLAVHGTMGTDASRLTLALRPCQTLRTVIKVNSGHHRQYTESWLMTMYDRDRRLHQSRRHLTDIYGAGLKRKVFTQMLLQEPSSLKVSVIDTDRLTILFSKFGMTGRTAACFTSLTAD